MQSRPISRRPRLLPIPRPFALVALAALALSCASTSELARRSTHALAAGDARAAWQWGERAMKKDPQSPVARDAMTAAAAVVVPDWQRRIRALAESDTIAAAKLSLDFAPVRAELGGWGITAPLDSAYVDDERIIRRAAARQLYRRANGELRAHHARDAYHDFSEVDRILPGYRKVGERIERSYEEALIHVAVVPFADESGVLAGDLAREMRDHLVRTMPAKNYPFVRFIENDAVFAALPAAPLDRDAAIHLARTVGAQRVVWGRIYGLDSDTHSESWDDRVWRRVAWRDTSGKEKVRWDPVDFRTTQRERVVHVSWEMQVIDTDEESTLDRGTGTEAATARTVWTDFDPHGDPREYAWAPPDWKEGRHDDWEGAETRWKSRYGDWSVSKMIESARVGREHPHYRREDRDRFFHSGHPLFMNDLPPREDLAYQALQPLEGRAEGVLKRLEAAAGAK